MIIKNRYVLLADLFLIAAAPILSFTIRLDTIRVVVSVIDRGTCYHEDQVECVLR